tara:strand:- start:468 stop:776 length:309 start_codon:yes stop_codon:yes gene_type:complete
MKPEEIRQRRENLGWSQQELAEKVGAPSSSVYKWEKGMSRPSRNNQKRLEDVFNGTADSGAVNASGINEYLHKRIADLEALVASQEKTIEAFRTALERIAKS